jgi:nicotinamidase/pyrazinamidase
MKRIFVDVDVQRDFCEPDGALFVKGAPNDLYRKLVAYALAWRIPVLGSVDTHAWDAWEFASSGNAGPRGEQPKFPDHCVKGTPGWLKVEGTLPPRARFLPNVPELPALDRVVTEVLQGETLGVYFEKEVYSLFANPLAERFVRTLVDRAGTAPEFFVFGVATDYCVRAAALGLRERGYRTALLEDAIVGITPEGVTAALEEMRGAGVRITSTAELFQ